MYLCFTIPADDVVRESHTFWATVIAVMAVLPFSWTHYAFFLLFPLVSLLADTRQRLRSAIGLGTGCLLLTLVHRYYAWLPPSPLLLGFVFLAYITMIVGTVRQP